MEDILKLLKKSMCQLGCDFPSVRIYDDWSGYVLDDDGNELFEFTSKQKLIDYLEGLHKKKMTVAEIEKELGYKIKIVK